MRSAVGVGFGHVGRREGSVGSSGCGVVDSGFSFAGFELGG